MTTRNILVVLPIQRDKTALAISDIGNDPSINIFYLDDPSFIYDSVCPDFDVVSYVDRAINYVYEHHINGVIYSHDMASLVAAAICEKTGLPGPSIDSMFISCHKFYSRQHEQESVLCQPLNIHQYDLQMATITYPCYIKAPCLMCSHLQFVVNDAEEMEHVLEIMRQKLPEWGKMFFDFFRHFISKEKFPLAHDEIILIEELVVDYSQCAIEGWVDSKGSIHVWAISDINYHSNTQRSQNCYSMPTATSESVQARMIALVTQTIGNHGIRCGFFNVDLWHWHDKKPAKIIEVNSRSASLYYLMHQKCFTSDLYKAMIYLSIGQDLECYLESPLSKSANLTNVVFGALFFVVTLSKGNASDFIDFENVKKMMASDQIHGMEMFIQPDSIISDNGTAGFRMSKFHVFGPSYQEICDIADYWRAVICKESSLVQSPRASAGSTWG